MAVPAAARRFAVFVCLIWKCGKLANAQKPTQSLPHYHISNSNSSDDENGFFSFK